MQDGGAGTGVLQKYEQKDPYLGHQRLTLSRLSTVRSASTYVITRSFRQAEDDSRRVQGGVSQSASVLPAPKCGQPLLLSLAVARRMHSTRDQSKSYEMIHTE